jgi:hypothetical protein
MEKSWRVLSELNFWTFNLQYYYQLYVFYYNKGGKTGTDIMNTLKKS